MNNLRKLMEMVEAGELGSVPTSNNDVEIDGQGIILYEDQVAIYDEAGEYQIFLPIETWNAFKEAGNTTSESINEDPDWKGAEDAMFGKGAFDRKPKEKPEFNKDGYRTVVKGIHFTGVEGDRYKVTATDYDSSVNTMSEVDGVMIGWYNKDRNENVWIHIDDLKRILNEIQGRI